MHIYYHTILHNSSFLYHFVVFCCFYIPKYVTINVYNYNGSQNVSEVALTYDFYFKFLEYDYIPVEFELYYVTGDEYIEIDEDWKTNYEFFLPAGENKSCQQRRLWTCGRISL